MGAEHLPELDVPGASKAPRRRLRRRVLIAVGLVLAVAVVVGFREARRARVRATVLPELERLGVRADTFGPTPVGFPVLVTLGPGRGEAWMRDHVGEGWFARPVGFHTDCLADDEAALVADRLRRLGGVPSFQSRSPRLTDAGVARLREAVPRATVIVYPETGRPVVYRSQRLLPW
jgi:hypothetical protein